MSLIALGVSGGIGAYKAVEIARGLQKQGHDVVAVMTRSAKRFVGTLTFEAITRHEVITDQWTPGANADIEHISLASTAGLLIVAPATANVIGKFANGIADDFLSSLYLATTAPVLMAPAMNTNMFAHPAVVRNLQTLASRGVMFVAPGEGYLACGWIGKGRLAEPADVVEAALGVLGPKGPLAGTRVLVTAGPTLEDIDPVRFVGNRSSGRMGYAIAAEAARRGARVTLVSGPTSLEPPKTDETVSVRSAADMHHAVMSRVATMDVVVMAAAVADYTVATPGDQKIAKRNEPLVLTLSRTKDILGDLARLPSRRESNRPLLVGFAAETHDVVPHARQKLERKAVDLVVANDVSQPGVGFDVST
ncbi:MAG: bifunctional phosphopantothenoylcysteine decarboxylase/phosphopantothenate--cysteine ligase CoaBC, partial [Vicinamibacterales bacterium]